MLVALTMPRLLETLSDRRVMLTGGIALPILLLAAAGIIAWLRWGETPDLPFIAGAALIFSASLLSISRSKG